METLQFHRPTPDPRKTASFSSDFGHRSSFSFSDADSTCEGSPITILSGSNTPAHETLSIGSPVSLVLNPDIPLPSSIDRIVSSSSTVASTSLPSSMSTDEGSVTLSPLYSSKNGKMRMNRLVSSLSYESLPELGSHHLGSRPSSSGLKRCRHSMNLSHLDLAASLGILPNSSSNAFKYASHNTENSDRPPRGTSSFFSEDLSEDMVSLSLRNTEEKENSRSDNHSLLGSGSYSDRFTEDRTDNYNTNKRIRLPTTMNTSTSLTLSESFSTVSSLSLLVNHNPENSGDDSNDKASLLSYPNDPQNASFRSQNTTSSTGIGLPSTAVSSSAGPVSFTTLPRVQSAPLFTNGTNSNRFKPNTNKSTSSATSVYTNWDGLNAALSDIRSSSPTRGSTTVSDTVEQHTGIFDTTMEDDAYQRSCLSSSAVILPEPLLNIIRNGPIRSSSASTNQRHSSTTLPQSSSLLSMDNHKNISTVTSSCIVPSVGLKKSSTIHNFLCDKP